MRRKQNRTPPSTVWSLGGVRHRRQRHRASSAATGRRRGPDSMARFPAVHDLPSLVWGRSCQGVPDCPPLKLARKAHWQAASATVEVPEIDANRSGAAGRLGLTPSLYRVVAHGRGFSPLPGRGGARNRAGRVTTGLNGGDAGKLLEAKERALRIGLPFNRFTTVHWDAAGVGDDLKATGRLLKLIGDWLRSRGRQAAFAWVREDGPRKGAHVHILLHLPPDLVDAFNRRQRGWLAACGARWRGGVLKTRSIGRTYRQALGGGQDYLSNLAETVDYVLKGADHRTRERFGIRRCEDGGVVVGKRCGVSQNLGPAACGPALKIQVNTEKFGKSGGAHGRR